MKYIVSICFIFLITLQTSFASLSICKVKISQKEDDVLIQVSGAYALWGEVKPENVVQHKDLAEFLVSLKPKRAVQFYYTIDATVEEDVVITILKNIKGRLSFNNLSISIGDQKYTMKMIEEYIDSNSDDK